MIDTQTPNSPGWWLKRLLTRLGDQRSRYDRLDAYYCGEMGIPVHADRAVREAYRRLMSLARTNFAELVVEAVRERMVPVGFRTGSDGDKSADDEAWRIWQANSLDADSALVTRASLSMSMAYVIVGGMDEEIGAPLITPEDPREVIAERDPVRRRKIRAALKVITDEVDGVVRAYLYLPGAVIRAVRPAVENGEALIWDMGGWGWEDMPGGPLRRLPAPVVPVVPFPNRDTLSGRRDGLGHAWGEFEPHIGLLDRINYTILNRLEVSTLQAFRQRAIKGDLPTTDAEGNPIDYDDIFAADPGALWLIPSTAELWESGQVDLGPILQAVRHDIQDLAAVTRTPLFYLTPDAANGSAEGASLAREGLTFKSIDRIGQATESWERVMSLAFLFAGQPERARSDMEVLWAPPERYSLAERADAASKAASSGMTWRTLMSEIWQFSPQQIDRMEVERATDAFLAPPVPPPSVEPPVVP